MDSLQYIQTVYDDLVKRAPLSTRRYYTVASCCPSRVNVLTGNMAPHNTKVTDLRLSFGRSGNETLGLVHLVNSSGYEKFLS
ncbi:hypothetical protein EJ08DRAFT_272486 [Tothia fuscella]|uniref:Sulfatase N-terminal domain-containing protein n=1 Tax=Tothia fuscella TaxID=1048955 RepID=A0A9P4NQX9_9PEZI|nr:hypothetical protein EJ08DRAFT_272486 [Tothia fuscella]